MRSHLSGFTMIELMVVLAVTIILVTLVVPSFTDQLARRRLEGAVTELSNDLQYARSQAVSNNATTTLATNAAGTQYTITSGSTTYKAVTLDSQLSVSPSITITYEQLRAMATASGVMTVSSSKTNGVLQVTVTPMGRVSVCAPSGSLKGYSSC